MLVPFSLSPLPNINKKQTRERNEKQLHAMHLSVCMPTPDIIYLNPNQTKKLVPIQKKKRVRKKLKK